MKPQIGCYRIVGVIMTALLTACSGSQPPIGAPGAIPQSRTIEERVRNGSSGIPPGTSSNDLVYVGTLRGHIYVFSYPDGDYVTSFTPPEQTDVRGLCTDSAGDIYAVGYLTEAWLFKYLHGATTPVSTTKLGGYLPSSCSVDPTTGNVAVLMSQQSKTYVAVFPSGSGIPTVYTVPNTQEEDSYACAYDDGGNLFMDVVSNSGWDLVELPAGSSNFSAWPLNKLHLGTSSLQWTSPYFTVSEHGTVYRLSVSGSTVTVAGSTRALQSRGEFWIEDGQTLIAPYGPKQKHNRVNEVAFWQYPKGGTPFQIIQRVDKSFGFFSAVTVSVAPSR